MGLRGPRPGTGGRPRKSLAEKVTEGNPGKRKLKVLDFEKIATEPEGVEMAGAARMRGIGISCSIGAICRERGSLDSLRGGGQQIWLSGQASNQLAAHTIALCRHEPKLHEADQSTVERDIRHRP